MTPDAVESLRKSQRPEKACIEKPVHVWGHPPQTVYHNNPKTITHQDKSNATAVPIKPSRKWYTKSQLMMTWNTRAQRETQAITWALSWLCKNRCNGNINAKLKCCGMKYKVTRPDCSATSSGCPKSLRIGVAKRYIGNERMQQRKRTIQDLCIYMPSMWYFFAPNAWPHRVSSALAIPNWLITN